MPRFGLVIWLPYVTIPHAVAWVPFHWFSTRHSSGERRSGSWRIPAWKARSDCRTQHDIRVTWASWWWILISSNETSTLYHTIFKVIYIYIYIHIQLYPIISLLLYPLISAKSLFCWLCPILMSCIPPSLLPENTRPAMAVSARVAVRVFGRVDSQKRPLRCYHWNGWTFHDIYK